MRSAAQAYGAIARQVASPRELEADLLLKAAARLQAVQDGWATRKPPQLGDALLYNRKLWTIFITSITTPKHPMPAEIRQNVAQLGLFVLQRSISILADPKRGELSTLIRINREVAAGLRGAP
jgi:flagellar biosynthesis activator protein FlaF